jgi:hypothetical protein
MGRKVMEANGGGKAERARCAPPKNDPAGKDVIWNERTQEVVENEGLRFLQC